MTELTFVIPCHNIDDQGYIINCVNSIRTTNPSADIIVIDSASPDKSYISKIDAEVLDIENKNYAFGAYWLGFKAKRESEFYLFTHDSTIIRNKITKKDFGTKPITPLYWFNDNNSPTWAHIKSWVINEAQKHAGYSFKEGEKCLYGGIFAATNQFMSKLEKDNLDKIRPTYKMEAVYTDEVLWSIAATANNQSIAENAFYGHADDILGKDKILWKFSGTIEKGRQ